MLLAGDVGGTKVRLALFDPKNLTCIQEKKYRSRDYPDLFSLVKDFLNTTSSKKITSLCVGVAGPVHNGRAQETNIPWTIDSQELSAALNISQVWVINDLEANAWGLSLLKKEELVCVNTGKKIQGNQALISAGTGLGEAGLYWDGTEHRPFACEGGHSDYAPTNEEEVELWRYLQKQFSHVSYERILCGSGLHQLYRFLVDTQREKSDPDIDSSDEPQRRITEKALEGTSQICRRAVSLFISIYGAEAGNLALKLFAMGGVFIGGGIAPHLVSFFKEKIFFDSFTAKGRFEEMMRSIPVHIILNDRTALLGAARYAQLFKLTCKT